MFKDTKGYQQSAVEQYFNQKKDDLSISQVAEYIQEVPTGTYARELIAYLFDKIAKALGHPEPAETTHISHRGINVPFETQYIYDDSMPITMEVVEQEGKITMLICQFKQLMYGKVKVGAEKEVEEEREIFEQGQDKIVKVGTKALTNILLPSHVSSIYGSRILLSGMVKDPQTVTDLSIPLELEQYQDGPGFRIDDVPFDVGGKYTISFEYQIIGGGVEDIDYLPLLYNEGKIYVDGELKANYGMLPSSEWPLTTGKHTFYLHFTVNSGESSFIWQFNENVPDGKGEVWITKLNIHEGHVHPFKEVN